MSKEKQIIKKRVTIIASIILLTAVVVFVFRNQIWQTYQGSDDPAAFVFDNQEFSEWSSSGSVYNGEAKGDEPLLAMSVHQCKEGADCDSLIEKCRAGEECGELEAQTVDGCFIQTYYFNQTIDTKKAAHEEVESWSSFGLEPHEVGVETLTMDTSEGAKDYQFYLYDTNNPDKTYRRGSAFGFLALSGGYVKVRAVCWEPEELSRVLTVLATIRLEL